MNPVNLNDSRIMAASEAAVKWNISDSAIRKRTEDFPDGTIKKFGKQWIVTFDGMISVFGNIKLKDDD